MGSQQEYSHLFKVLFMGGTQVGKSCFIGRFTDDTFYKDYISTIGVDFRMKIIETSRKDSVKLQIWDTAGQEKFRTITSSYHRGCHAFIFMYDVTNMTTFKDLSEHLENAERYGPDNAIKILVGHKADFDLPNRDVSEEMGREFAEENGLKFYEASARDNQNVTKIFQELADAFVENLPKESRDRDQVSMSTAPGSFNDMMREKKKRVKLGKKAHTGNKEQKSSTCSIL